MAPTEGEARPIARTSETLKLSLVFGTISFVQGIGEPTEGLIAQPVRSLLKSWGLGAGPIATFSAILALPWALKPLYGLLSDFVPLAGTRRQGYLIATSAATLFGLVLAYALPGPGERHLLLALLLVPTVAVAFADVVADGLMVETGQPLGITGRLQAVQWGCLWAATIVTGQVGGYLSASGRERIGFLICACLSVVTLVLAVGCVREPARPARRTDVREALSALRMAARSPTVVGVGGFLFLWNFNPFSTAVLYLHMTGALGFGERFYGSTVSLMAVGSVVACVGYGWYSRRVPLPWLVHASIALGVLSTLCYWALGDRTSAVAVALVVGITYMTATLVQLDMAARACPPEAAGTVFALLMALQNLSASLSTWLGGLWYDRWAARWGTRAAFDLLVGVGAAFTASCWIWLFLLPRFPAKAVQSREHIPEPHWPDPQP